MARGGWLALATGAVVACYPLVVYLGINLADPRWVAMLLLIAVSLRLANARLTTRMTLALVAAMVVATGLTLITGSERGLLIYPVLVNTVLFVIFTASLLKPPSIVEILARRQEPNLSAQAVKYTRNVTLVWAIFFVFNGSMAALTLKLSPEYWAIYNGLIAYLLMAVLFLGEWLLRKKFKDRHGA